MPPILHNTTNKELTVPSDEAPRILLRNRKANLSSAKHSPDGYFAHEELGRTWQPLTSPDAANFRNRNRMLNHVNPPAVLQEVAEEETMDPHAWRPPSMTDSRGPCPALGALSNHGYLPRDGRNIGIWTMVQALREGYGGSWTYAFALTVVSYTILRLGGVGKGWLRPTIDLEDLGAHGVLEHDGSLAHADIEEDDEIPPHDLLYGDSTASLASSTAVSLTTTNSHILITPSTLQSFFSRVLLALVLHLPMISRLFRSRAHVYAPTRPSRRLIRELLADSASGTHFTLADAARARVRREASSRPIPSRIIRQFADGEFAMTIDILGHDGRIELGVLRTWLEEERLPPGWAPTHVQGIWRTHTVTGKLQALIHGLRRYRGKGRDVRSIVYE